jgi:hypothetical protein
MYLSAPFMYSYLLVIFLFPFLYFLAYVSCSVRTVCNLVWFCCILFAVLIVFLVLLGNVRSLVCSVQCTV